MLVLVGDALKVVPIGVVENVDELSRIRIFPEYRDGIFRLEEFSHIIVLYWFHERDTEDERRVLPALEERGFFERIAGGYGV